MDKAGKVKKQNKKLTYYSFHLNNTEDQEIQINSQLLKLQIILVSDAI